MAQTSAEISARDHYRIMQEVAAGRRESGGDSPGEAAVRAELVREIDDIADQGLVAWVPFDMVPEDDDEKPGGGELTRAFDESQHERDESGRFTSGGGSDSVADLREGDEPSDRAPGKASAGGQRPARAGHSSTKVGADGKLVLADGSPLPEHAAKLKIPPAWTDVTVSADPRADVVAVGKDKKGRTVRMYSESHHARQAEKKFKKTREILRRMDDIREKIRARTKDGDARVAESARVLSLIQATGLRPGSERDTGADKQAYGATTLEGRHVKVNGDKVSLAFVGKKGVNIRLAIEDQFSAKLLAERAKTRGRRDRLFDASDADLREMARSLGPGIRPKDFRTAKGTSMAHETVSKTKAPKTAAEYKKAVKSVAKRVSEQLGNTPTVALQSYIDPHVFAKWREGVGA